VEKCLEMFIVEIHLATMEFLLLNYEFILHQFIFRDVHFVIIRTDDLEYTAAI
jgi:hypothetical protein